MDQELMTKIDYQMGMVMPSDLKQLDSDVRLNVKLKGVYGDRGVVTMTVKEALSGSSLRDGEFISQIRLGV